MRKNLLFLFSLIVLHYEMQAGGFKIALQGQKQIGMGSTGVGFAQDAATVYFNPAGMSFVGSQINAGINALCPTTSYLDKSTNQLHHAASDVFAPFSVYASGKLFKRLSVGIGIYTPFGSGLTYHTNWIGRYTLNSILLQTVFIQPSLSYRITDKLSIGAGYIYALGNVSLNRDIPLNSGAAATVANAQLDGKAGGMGFSAGAYYKASDKVQLGATYHSKVQMKVDDGEAVFSDIPAALASSFPKHNTFTSELNLPSEIAVGVSYKMTDDLTLALDFNHTFWSSFDSLGFDYGINSASLLDKKSPRLYQNASCIRFGAQYHAGRVVDLRGGIFFDQTPVQDDYVVPELPDNNKVGLTLGATFRIEECLQMDLSLLYEHVAAREQRNIETGLEGTFQTRVLAPGIGLSYLLKKRTIKHTYQ